MIFQSLPLRRSLFYIGCSGAAGVTSIPSSSYCTRAKPHQIYYILRIFLQWFPLSISDSTELRCEKTSIFDYIFASPMRGWCRGSYPVIDRSIRCMNTTLGVTCHGIGCFPSAKLWQVSNRVLVILIPTLLLPCASCSSPSQNSYLAKVVVLYIVTKLPTRQ